MDARQASRGGIEGCGLRFAYAAREVVAGVDVSVRPFEFIGLVGPNGAGKSTLLRLLVGILRPGAGKVIALGDDLSALSQREVARRVAFVPQAFQSEFAFTARELVAMGRIPHLGRFEPERGADRAAIEAALVATDTTALAHRPASQLSSGELQRVILARAFAQESPVMVLDEPSSSLDLRHSHDLLVRIRARVDDGGAAIIAIHDLQLALQYCTRLVVMAEGVIKAAGQPEAVISAELLREVFGVHGGTVAHDGRTLLAISGPS